jgi:hypothetical protein
LRQRATVADQELEACVRTFQAEAVPNAMLHNVAERRAWAGGAMHDGST